MTLENPAISVVIPTYRRHKYLLKVLDDMAPQTYQPTELIIVDSSPDEEALTAAEVARYPAWLNYRRVARSGNVSWQRNEALKLCRGDIVLCLDDDIEYGPELLANYVKAFQETGADGISGLVMLPGQQPLHSAIQLRTVALINPGAPNYQLYDDIVPTHVICTASFAVRRAAILAVGGFDEQLRGTCDDLDLGIRLVKAGFNIIHHHVPSVLHLRVPASGSRAPEIGPACHFSNWFYLQFRHFWKHPYLLLLFVSLYQYCRPSRHWLQPRYVIQQARALVAAYNISLERLAEGPITLKSI
jgi:GT2 family glycosyltransferase